VRETFEDFLLMTSRPETKLCDNDCWESGSSGNLLDEIIARQVVAGRVVSYVEAPSDKAVGESLGELLGEKFTRQVTGRIARRIASYAEPPSDEVASDVEPPSDKARGELLGESLLVELLGFARQVVAGRVAPYVCPTCSKENLPLFLF
jgi:hypothetical protein